jgi:hypothetical protein
MSDLNIRALHLLDFVEGCIKNGLEDTSSMLQCFRNADSMLLALGKILYKEDRCNFHNMALGRLFETSFVAMADSKDDVNVFLETVIFCRSFFTDNTITHFETSTRTPTCYGKEKLSPGNVNVLGTPS